MIPPTREQHDRIVAYTGRPYTADPMKTRSIDEYAPDIDGLTVIDEYVKHARKAARDA